MNIIVKKENLKLIEVNKGTPGVGVPVGGNQGQVLAKKSTNAYDTEWVDVAKGTAAETTYDNTDTPDLGTNVQEVIEELNAKIGSGGGESFPNREILLRVEQPFLTSQQIKLDTVQYGAQVNDNAQQIKIKYESNSDTNAFTDDEKLKLDGIQDNANNYVLPSELPASMITESTSRKFITEANLAKLSGIEENAQVNDTAIQVKAKYESNADTNAFTDLEKNKLDTLVLTDNNFTNLEKLKLAGIQQNAQVNDTASQIKAKYESNTDTNAFTDLEKNKLDTLVLTDNNFTDGQRLKLLGIESGAQVNDTATEIKIKYESNADTNVFTDALKQKLSLTEMYLLKDKNKLALIEDMATRNPDAANRSTAETISGKWTMINPSNKFYGDGSHLTNLPVQTDNNFTDNDKSKLDHVVLDTRQVLGLGGLGGGRDLKLDAVLTLDYSTLPINNSHVRNDYVVWMDEETGSHYRATVDSLCDNDQGGFNITGFVVLNDNTDGGLATRIDDMETHNVSMNSNTDPHARQGDVYILKNTVKNNTITGEVENYAVGDFIIWLGSEWRKMSNGVMSVQGHEGDVIFKLGDISSDVINYGSRQTSVTAELDSHHLRINSNDDDIAALRADLTQTDKNASDLTSRVTENERDIAVNTSGIAVNLNSIQAIQARNTIQDTNIAKNAADIKRVQTQANDNSASIIDNRTNIALNLEKIDGNRTNIGLVNERVAKVESRVSVNESGIKANKDNIALNLSKINQNTSNIQMNKDNIALNLSKINQNTSNIQMNKDNITLNTSEISKSNVRITSAENKLVEHTTLINQNVVSINNLNDGQVEQNKVIATKFSDINKPTVDQVTGDIDFGEF